MQIVLAIYILNFMLLVLYPLYFVCSEGNRTHLVTKALIVATSLWFLSATYVLPAALVGSDPYATAALVMASLLFFARRGGNKQSVFQFSLESVMIGVYMFFGVWGVTKEISTGLVAMILAGALLFRRRTSQLPP